MAIGNMDSLADKLKNLKKTVLERVRKVRDAEISIEIDHEARYPNGKKVDVVANYIEYGTRYMPPRPFMRTAVSENTRKWYGKIDEGVVRIFQGKGDNYRQLLNRVANGVVQDVKDSITAFEAVDTGRLLDSVKAVVKEGE